MEGGHFLKDAGNLRFDGIFEESLVCEGSESGRESGENWSRGRLFWNFRVNSSC